MRAGRGIRTAAVLMTGLVGAAVLAPGMAFAADTPPIADRDVCIGRDPAGRRLVREGDDGDDDAVHDGPVDGDVHRSDHHDDGLRPVDVGWQRFGVRGFRRDVVGLRGLLPGVDALGPDPLGRHHLRLHHLRDGGHRGRARFRRGEGGGAARRARAGRHGRVGVRRGVGAGRDGRARRHDQRRPEEPADRQPHRARHHPRAAGRRLVRQRPGRVPLPGEQGERPRRPGRRPR